MPREALDAALRGTALAASAMAIALLASCGGGGSPDSTTAGAQSGQPPAKAANVGEAAGPGDRATAARAVRGFLRALTGNDSARACSLMAASTKRDLEVFAGQLKSGGCTGQLEAVRSRMPAKMLAATKRIQVTGVRIEGERGFVLYRDAGATNSAFPIVREGSAWKVGAIAGTRIP